MSVSDPRLLFPLAPILAVLALSMCGVLGSAHGFNSGPPPAPPLLLAHSLSTVAGQYPPSRALPPPKYNVKFLGYDLSGVDYDPGGGMIAVKCAFQDLDPEHPVVGMSSLGLLRRIQTDAGALTEGSDGLGIINPAIHAFKDAHFLVRAKVPMATRAVIMLNASLTVLRACESADFTWRGPFGAETGRVEKSGGFEIVLTKARVEGELLNAEWSCRPAPDAAIDAAFWTCRKLKTTLTFTDKSSADAISGSETPYLIQRVYKLGAKAPLALKLSFISVLHTENLPFTLTNLKVGGDDKNSAPASGQNF